MRNKRKVGKTGFSLIELMVVITIISILATIVIFKVTSTGDDARKSATIAKMSQIADALEMFKLKFNKYPDSFEELFSEKEGFSALKEAGRYDGWGNEFHYSREGNNFRLTSYGSDGKSGSSADDPYAEDIVWTKDGLEKKDK